MCNDTKRIGEETNRSTNKCESTNTTNEQISKADKMQTRTADGVVNRSLVSVH